MHRLISLKELLEILNISKATYYTMTNPKHPSYNPDMPKKIEAFGSKLTKFSSIDVNNFIEKVSHTHSEKAA